MGFLSMLNKKKGGEAAGEGASAKAKASSKSVAKKASAKSAKKAGDDAKASILKHVEGLWERFPAVAETKDDIGIEIEEDKLLELLGKLIGETEKLQNFPPEFIPKEDLAVAHILDTLNEYTIENGGPLSIETHDYVEGRSNVIIRYAAANPTDKTPTICLIGSHLDVVPASPETWERNPFELTREGDKLFGRGTTDCLGHVAVITLFMEQLAQKKPELSANVAVVFIASEEAIDKPGAGVDGLMNAGHLDILRENGSTCLWIDSSDSEPCMGTAGALQWHLHTYGKRFHSGLPHKAINSIELGTEAVRYIQDRFYEDFPPHPEETRYRFMTPSTMKPTQIKCAKNGLNVITPECTVSGDCRITPFYSCVEVAKKLQGYVDELNKTKFAALTNRGTVSKFELPDEGLVGRIELEWSHSGSPELMSGIAVDIDGQAFSALCSSINTVRGSVMPYSVNGSLPLVFEMQKAGFDLNILGFGLSEAYHAENEFALLSDLINGSKVLSNFVSKMNAVYAAKSEAK
mmetsp:Transcript_1761/g.2779  ORF Transcript_1761/g.2779 Transcript_1761/m.2779 type:complete len:520 (+) Transcript_1761:131-1690(+)